VETFCFQISLFLHAVQSLDGGCLSTLLVTCQTHLMTILVMSSAVRFEAPGILSRYLTSPPPPPPSPLSAFSTLCTPTSPPTPPPLLSFYSFSSTSPLSPPPPPPPPPPLIHRHMHYNISLTLLLQIRSRTFRE
jgi:hypothetical protein